MSSVLLRYREVSQQDGLPRICMKCGQPATLIKVRKFSWTPPWTAVLLLAGLVPYVIVAVILTKRMTVDVPLCDEHQNHWFKRSLFTWVSLAIIALLGIGAFAFVIVMEEQRGPLQHAAGLSCLGVLVLFVLWLIPLLIVQFTAIRPTEITDDDIRLTNVSPTFVEAIEKMRDARRASPGSRRGDDDEYEDDEEDNR